MNEETNDQQEKRDSTFVSSNFPDDGTIGNIPSLVGKRAGGKYEVLALVGRGGMGTLYSGRHVEIGRKVAIKVLHKDFRKTDAYLRFKQEAKMAATLSHNNICSVYDFGEFDDGTPYLVMDLLEGKTLGEIRKEQGHLPWKRAVNICVQICDALSHAHSKGILHRDLKPSNVMIQEDGANENAKLVDFGIAKSLDADSPQLTSTHESMGTPYYMSPEQCKAQKVDHRSDIYSLGCLMYEILTGRPPFMAEDALQAMFAHVTAEPESSRRVAPNADIPEQLDRMVLKAIRKDPNERFQSAEEMKQAILAASGESSNVASAREPAAPSKAKEEAARPEAAGKQGARKLVLPAVVVAILIGIAAFLQANQANIALILDGRRPGEIYNGDDGGPLVYKLRTITRPQVHAIYLGQAHDTPRSKDNDLSIMGHATVRVTNRTPHVILVLTSHAQVEWNIVSDPGTEVVKVLLSSTYGEARARGVPSNRVIQMHPAESFSFYLSDPHANLNEESAFNRLNQEVKKVLGNEVTLARPINTFQYAQQLKEFQIPSPIPF